MKKMPNLNSLFVLSLPVACSLMVLSGCESRSVEKAPETISVSADELSLDERVKIQEDMDARLDQVDSASQKVLKTISHLKKVTSKALGHANPGGEYTLVDFLLDINDAFKGKLPKVVRSQDGSHVRYSKVKLPADLFNESCRELDARLVAHVDSAQRIVDVEYSLSSCSNPLTFVPIAHVVWNSEMRFDFDRAGLKEVFNGAFEKSIGDQLGCTAKTDSGDYYKIVSVNCSTVNMKLSADVELRLKDLMYTDFGTRQISAYAQLIEGGVHKADLILSGSSNGSVNVDVQRVDDRDDEVIETPAAS